MRRLLSVLALVVTAAPLTAQSDRTALTRRLDSLSVEGHDQIPRSQPEPVSSQSTDRNVIAAE